MEFDTAFDKSPTSGFNGTSLDSLNAVSFEDFFGATPSVQAQERSLDNLPSMAAELCGLTGDMDPYVLRRYRYNDNSEFEFSKLSIRATQDEAVPVQFLLSPTDLSSASRTEAELEDGGLRSMDSDRERLSELIPIEIGKRLIQLFIRFVCPQFPILSKTAPPDPQTAPIVQLLAAIYCVAQPFAIYDDRLCIDFAYRAPSTETLFNISWRSLNRALNLPTLAAVQSGLVLLLRPPVNELVLDSGFKWSLLGTVVSLAQSIGLHLDASSWKLPREELLLRKRISWAVYAFDNWLALSLGRPSHINKLDWLIVQLEAADLGDETDNLPPKLSICLQFSRLTSILDRVLTELYSVRIATTLASNHKATLQASQPLLVLLTSWYQSLDSYFHNTTTEDLSGDPDPRSSVHLCYYAVKIVIIRALLRPFYHAGATQSTDPRERANWESATYHSRLGAKMCANAAVKHVASLRAAHYQAFWAPWCKTHLAMITNLHCLLAITSPQDEFTGAMSSLNQARAIFRVQARSCPMIQFALLRIDAIFWVGFDAVINNNNHDILQ
ncbi:hypothetical protein VTL71DRAFT_8918 [Oculimacula yallundae]|uniref:Xylanolytic transcriptional activator regulatory domain-containing protein n=1 Tax=Oculimacula yallundae TaxID=86028 RepID=A0ABR4BT98_9HELO